MSCARDGYVPAVRGVALGAVHRVGQDVGVGVTAHVQHRDRQRALHRLHESTALTSQLTAHRPALVLQRGMRRRRDLHRLAQMADGLREVLRGLPFGTRPTADQCFEFGSVVAGQHPLRPERQLVAQHPGQQRQALVAPGQRGGAQRDRVRGTDHGDRAHRPRVQHRRRPAHQAAVGMADQRGVLVPQRAHQARRVAGQRPAVVAARRFVAAAVAPQVDGHHACARSGRAADAATTTRTTRTRAGVSPAVARETPSRRLSVGSASTTWKRIPLACTSR